MMVADFADAFFLVPLHADEWQFFAVRFRERFHMFLKTTQGSRGAPLTWARLAALVARHRCAEVDASYTAYDQHPADEPDEWGDLASWRRAASTA